MSVHARGLRGVLPIVKNPECCADDPGGVQCLSVAQNATVAAGSATDPRCGRAPREFRDCTFAYLIARSAPPECPAGEACPASPSIASTSSCPSPRRLRGRVHHECRSRRHPVHRRPCRPSQRAEARDAARGTLARDLGDQHFLDRRLGQHLLRGALSSADFRSSILRPLVKLPSKPPGIGMAEHHLEKAVAEPRFHRLDRSAPPRRRSPPTATPLPWRSPSRRRRRAPRRACPSPT